MTEQKDYQAEYFSHKADAEAIKQAIAEKDAEIRDIQRRINDAKADTTSISERLKVNEFSMQSTSRVIRPTMTVDEFMAGKKQVAELENEVKLLAEALDYNKMAMTALQSDLSNAAYRMRFAKEQITIALVEQSADALVDAAGDQLRDFIMAIVARNNKQQGFALDAKGVFESMTNADICRTLVKRAFGNQGLPQLHEADKYVIDKIESAA